jgi:hypothetical protein
MACAKHQWGHTCHPHVHLQAQHVLYHSMASCTADMCTSLATKGRSACWGAATWLALRQAEAVLRPTCPPGGVNMAAVFCTCTALWLQLLTQDS